MAGACAVGLSEISGVCTVRPTLVQRARRADRAFLRPPFADVPQVREYLYPLAHDGLGLGTTFVCHILISLRCSGDMARLPPLYV